MAVHKRKKASRYRGSTTHGCGSMKKRRGAGNRGGRGMAGTGKRADTKKPKIWKNKKYFGRHGFKRHGQVKKIKAVNIDDIENNIDKLVAAKLATKEKDKYVIDLNKAGYNKLLGKGKIKNKYKITVDGASKKAVDKIKKLGGEVIVKEKKIVIKEEEPKKKEVKEDVVLEKNIDESA